MGKKFQYFIDDEHDELINRYEKFLSGAASGYFEVEELGSIVEYYLQRGKTSESLKAWEFGKKLHPESSLLDLKRAKIYLTSGDAQKANRILDSQIESNEPEVVQLKIETLIKLGREKEAYGIALRLIDGEDDEKEWMCLDLAMVFMTENSFKFALELLKKGEEITPRNIDILFEKAFCYERLNDLEPAISAYDKIVSIDAYSAEAWFNLGQIHFNLNQFEKALEAYDYALTINDGDVIALMQKAHSLYQLNRYNDAVQVYLEYVEFAVEKWQVYTFIGECYEKLEDYVKALHYYQLSMDETPNNFDALVGATICMLEMEEYLKSLEYILKAIELDDKAADVWVYLAEAKTGLGNTDEALEAYLKSISIDPTQPDVLMSVAGIYMDEGKFAEAIKYYELAYNFDNNLEMIELFMAVGYYYMGDMEKTSHFLHLALQKSLDAFMLFQEFCPDAGLEF